MDDLQEQKKLDQGEFCTVTLYKHKASCELVIMKVADLSINKNDEIVINQYLRLMMGFTHSQLVKYIWASVSRSECRLITQYLPEDKYQTLESFS